MAEKLRDRLETAGFVAANALLTAKVASSLYTFFRPDNLSSLYQSLNHSVVETVLSPMQYMR